MIDDGVSMVQGDGVSCTDLAMAMQEIEDEGHQAKILDDLLDDGYSLEEANITELFEIMGQCPIFDRMLEKYTGTLSKKTICMFYEYGTTQRLYDEALPPLRW